MLRLELDFSPLPCSIHCDDVPLGGAPLMSTWRMSLSTRKSLSIQMLVAAAAGAAAAAALPKSSSSFSNDEGDAWCAAAYAKYNSTRLSSARNRCNCRGCAAQRRS